MIGCSRFDHFGESPIKMPAGKTYVHLTNYGNDLNKSVRSVAGMTGDAGRLQPT